MNRKIGWAFALGLLAAAPAAAQVPQQCVTNAQGQGTGDAITVPLLPCGLATNILILTLPGANTTNSPTLQMAGYPALPILTSTYGNPAVGQLPGIGDVVLLTSTGSAWLIVSNATAPLSLPVTVPEGGTGDTTLGANGLLFGNGASAVGVTAAGATGQYVKGTTAAAPSWGTLATDAVTGLSFGTTGLTPSTATQGSITVAGTLVVANGGSGLTTRTAHSIQVGNGTGAVTQLAVGTTGQALLGSTGADPVWGTAGTVTSIATTSPITGGTITGSGTIACATCVTSAASLTSGSVMTGAGSQASQTNADLTFATGTLALGVNTSEAGAVKLFGGTSGNLSLKAAAAAGTNTILTFPGATFDFSASGGTSQVVKQTSSGGAFSVARLACADMSDSGTACTAATGTSGATLGFLNGTNTYSALQTFSGTSAVAAVSLVNAKEPGTISATAATGTINYDVCTQSVLYYTSSAAANWTLNLRCSAGTALNTMMATGDIVTVTFLVTQGASPFYNNVLNVDGSAVTPKCQGGTCPSAGNASGIDVYTYAIVKTANATFTVLESQTQFK